MKYPRISIIIPSYNKVDYIKETLDSIAEQKYSNLEIIIQDGVSNDGTLGIIRKYVEKQPEILKYESKKDHGQLDAINKGLKKTTGDIISYLNADDVYFPGTFRAVAREYNKHPNSLWYAGRGVTIDSKSRELKSYVYRLIVKPYKNILLSINYYPFLLLVNYLMQPSVFLNKTALKKVGGFSGTKQYVLEYDMWLKLAKYEMPTIIKENLSGFRLCKGSVTTSSSKKLLLSDYGVVKKYTNNKAVLLLHKLNNEARLLVSKLTVKI